MDPSQQKVALAPEHWIDEIATSWASRPFGPSLSLITHSFVVVNGSTPRPPGLLALNPSANTLPFLSGDSTFFLTICLLLLFPARVN